MKHQFKIILTASAIVILSLAANAQTTEEPMRHWQASIEASTYNTLDWGLELGIKYRPIKYVGVKASLGFASNFSSGERSFTVGNMLVKTDNVDNALWLSTGIQLQSPALWRNHDGDLQLSLKVEAGISLPFPTNGKVGYITIPNQPGTYAEPPKEYQKNHGGTGCFFHLKPAVALDIDRCQIWAGYTWSNMDVYSNVRNVVIMGHPLNLPHKRTMHGLTVGFGYCF